MVEYEIQMLMNMESWHVNSSNFKLRSKVQAVWPTNWTTLPLRTLHHTTLRFLLQRLCKAQFPGCAAAKPRPAGYPSQCTQSSKHRQKSSSYTAQGLVTSHLDNLKHKIYFGALEYPSPARLMTANGGTAPSLAVAISLPMILDRIAAEN